MSLHSRIVADTWDLSLVQSFKPQDVTTNPSLMFRALQQSDREVFLSQAQCESIATVGANVNSRANLTELMDRISVRLGCTLLEQVPGRVSIEVDPRLSFDRESTLFRARRLMSLFESEGFVSEHVLIKIAATWEGIQAAKQLELEGIRTNLTLVFSFAQAVACAQAKVQLISPFVGRIYDWHKKVAGPAWDEEANSGLNDPGVKSVHAIYNYFKHFDIPTEIMGASFRNLGQILALSGCDLLTISPDLLQQLAEYEQSVSETFPALSVQAAKAMDLQPVEFDEAAFRWALNEDPMATEKLAEGIRAFAADTRKLEALIQAH